MKKYLKTLVYIILVLLAAVSVLQGAKNALKYSQDFQYDAALALKCGINPYLESLEPTGILEEGPTADFYRIFEESNAPQKMEANQFPSLLMLLFPMTILPYTYARIAWLILNLIFTAAIIVFLRKTFFKDCDRDVFCMLMLLMLAGTPYRNQLGVGQHSLFSFAFFLLAVYLSDREKPVLSGLALAVSYFKYTLTAPLALYFLYKRKYREFIISLVPHIIGTFIGAAMLKTSFIDMIIEPLKVSSALSGEGSIDIGAMTNGGLISIVLTVLIMAALLIAAFKLPEGHDAEYFALLTLISLIMTYHRIYDFFVLAAAASGTLLLTLKAGEYNGDSIKLKEKVLTGFYILLLLYFFFVMRIFNDSSFSVTLGAVLYYVYLSGWVLCRTNFI